jgi:hypothetical protein
MAGALVEMMPLVELASLALKERSASFGQALAPSQTWQANNQE